MGSIKQFFEKYARVIVVAMVVVGAIATLALAADNSEEPETNQPEATAAETPQNEENSQPNTVPAAPEGAVIGSEPMAGPVVVDEEEVSYSATVRRGDNQTVIVRQIVNEYLQDTNQSLSAEKRLFIETVVVNSLPRNDLIFAGQVVDVSKQTLADATQQSNELTQAQLNLWATYL